jgi:hypothetical protein
MALLRKMILENLQVLNYPVTDLLDVYYLVYLGLLEKWKFRVT